MRRDDCFRAPGWCRRRAFPTWLSLISQVGPLPPPRRAPRRCPQAAIFARHEAAAGPLLGSDQVASGVVGPLQARRDRPRCCEQRDLRSCDKVLERVVQAVAWVDDARTARHRGQLARARLAQSAEDQR